MLVLSRKQNETIVIGDDIEISILEIKGGKVRLGVQAPREILVLRQEVVDRLGTSDPCNHACSC